MSQAGTSRGTESIANGLEEDQNRKYGDPRRKRSYRKPLLDFPLGILRRKISQKRYRFEYKNLDLDMAYITDRIIALGYPASSFESQFRNTMDNTREMLWRRHGVGHVKVFNLRGGYLYNPEKFDSNVIYLDMTDHHPPKLELMAPFCREASKWLQKDEENVIAVHCKAGKGRTGVMICALLIYIQFYSMPRQILDYYSIVRTMNNQGVTIPSQRRYIYYYALLREKKLNYFPLRMQLIGVYIERPPKRRFKIQVSNGSRVVFSPKTLSISNRHYDEERRSWRPVSDIEADYENKEYVSKRAYCFMVPDNNPVFVEGDVRVDLFNSESGVASLLAERKIGHVWFNTMFACGHGFVYGDKKDPYEEMSTSIGRRGAMLSSETVLEAPDIHRPKMQKLWKIVKPPKLDEHTPDPERIYGQYGMKQPRIEIARRLYKAHDLSIVKDTYTQRQFKEKGVAYDTPGEQFAGDGGPYQVPLNSNEHVLTFPVYEMDRALKNGKIDNGMKMHVVLRCIDASDEQLFENSEEFCDLTFKKDQAQANRVPKRMRRYLVPATDNATIGAERMRQPAVRYAQGDNYSGKAHDDLTDRRFKDSKLARSNRWCRFYYKQGDDSDSDYPEVNHKCSLTKKIFHPKEPEVEHFDESDGGPEEYQDNERNDISGGNADGNSSGNDTDSSGPGPFFSDDEEDDEDQKEDDILQSGSKNSAQTQKISGTDLLTKDANVFNKKTFNSGTEHNIADNIRNVHSKERKEAYVHPEE